MNWSPYREWVALGTLAFSLRDVWVFKLRPLLADRKKSRQEARGTSLH